MRNLITFNPDTMFMDSVGNIFWKKGTMDMQSNDPLAPYEFSLRGERLLNAEVVFESEELRVVRMKRARVEETTSFVLEKFEGSDAMGQGRWKQVPLDQFGRIMLRVILMAVYKERIHGQ